jgi:hypothetical protein
MQMYVTEASSLRAAVAQCRQFVALHGGEPEAFPGGDVWLDGEQLVFAVGHGDGQDARFHEVAAGEFKRFFPRASGNYRMIEETGEWRLITRGSLISRTA